MATYDLNLVANAVVLEVKRQQMAVRYERHYNILAQAGLLVGDIVFFDIDVPDWVRTIIVSKRTNTANADSLTVQCQDSGLPIPPVLPIKTAAAVQVGGSSSASAGNAVLMQLYPVGNKIRVQLTLVTSVPTQALLSVAFHDY